MPICQAELKSIEILSIFLIVSSEGIAFAAKFRELSGTAPNVFSPRSLTRLPAVVESFPPTKRKTGKTAPIGKICTTDCTLTTDKLSRIACFSTSNWASRRPRKS